MHGALLVAHENMLKPVRLLEQRIVNRQHRSAGIAEDVLHALVHQRLDHHLGAGHLFAHCFAPPAHRACPSRIKKGHKGPLRTAFARVALATLGGACTYDYQSNKISHFGSH